MQGSGESGRETEAADPEDVGLAFESPVTQLLHSTFEVVHPGVQGLQTVIAEAPGTRHFIQVQVLIDDFEVLGN